MNAVGAGAGKAQIGEVKGGQIAAPGAEGGGRRELSTSSAVSRIPASVDRSRASV